MSQLSITLLFIKFLSLKNYNKKQIISNFYEYQYILQYQVYYIINILQHPKDGQSHIKSNYWLISNFPILAINTNG